VHVPVSAVDAISLAIEHTKKQVFKPFRLGQWNRLAIVGLLAGELSSGGCNFTRSFNSYRHVGAGADSPFPSFPNIDFALLGGLIATLVITGIVLGLLFMYISSVMRFVLFDSILAKECHIRAGWNRRQGSGFRYFLWKLLYMFASLGGFAVLIGIPLAFAFALGWIQDAKNHVLPLVLCGIALFFLLLIFVFTLLLIFVLTKDFVIPQMAFEDIGAIEAWQRLWPMMRAEIGAYAAYIGMKIALAIGAGILVTIATFILGLIIAIPTVGLSILAIFTGKSAGLTWNAYTITSAIVVGSVLITIFLYLVSLITVPVIVFFPAYSIYFFAARYRPLSMALYPVSPSAAITPAAIPPFSPPPLPPYPEPTG
jgi:hypothetical protein